MADPTSQDRPRVYLVWKSPLNRDSSFCKKLLGSYSTKRLALAASNIFNTRIPVNNADYCIVITSMMLDTTVSAEVAEI